MKEKVLILGLSKSGIAAAKYAVTKNYDVYITEGNSTKEEYLPQIDYLKSLGIKIETNGHTEEFISGSSFAVTSPGIPPKSEIFRRLNEKNIPIISEIEFAYKNTKTPFIAITGTNGKTTTTALVSHILEAKYKAPFCGNIGVPPTDLIKDNKLAQILASSGFRDTTRLALSNSELANDMVNLNKQNIIKAFNKYKDCVENLLNSNVYYQEAKRIKNFRDNL